MLIAPIKRLSEVASPISRGLAAVQRAMDLIEKTPAESGGTHAPGRAQGRIELRVGQRALPRRRARPRWTASRSRSSPARWWRWSGPSGSGKTTLANLLPRFVQPTEGRVLLDGHDVADWRLDALRSQFALVSQDVVMFNDTLAANIALGSPRDAGAAGALRGRGQPGRTGGGAAATASRPSSATTPSTLSGGQRQRLAIARALYKDAPMLILDEATSALDSASERLVQEALQRLMAGRTTLIIAHRLSTIEHADRRGGAGPWQAGRKRQPCAVAGPRRAVRAAARTAIRDRHDDCRLWQAARWRRGPGRARLLPAVFLGRGVACRWVSCWCWDWCAPAPCGAWLPGRSRPWPPGSRCWPTSRRTPCGPRA